MSFFAWVYYEFCRQNEVLDPSGGIYDPSVLVRLDLSPNADETDIKRRLGACQGISPDADRNSVKFAELMLAYLESIGK